MIYLLDTHIWLWSALAPEKIKPRIARLMQDPDAELWVSTISTWEFFSLARKGRIVVTPTPEIWIEGLLRAFPFREAPLTNRIVKGMNQIEMPHRDPADWLIAATARSLGATLITSDGDLRRAKGVKILFNG